MASRARPLLFPRDLRRRYRTITHGVGVRLYDTDGREEIDADSGAISVVSPPLTVTADVDEIVARLGRALDDARPR